MKKVAILFGGNSFEHEISLKSAKYILENINPSHWNVEAIWISKENKWYYYRDSLEQLENGNIDMVIEQYRIPNIIECLSSYDIIFPILHGRNGEDGRLQGMLDLFQIKYVGFHTLESAITMDKEFTKYMCEKINIPQIPYYVLRKKEDKIEEIEGSLNYPMIVKPANGGSSIGMNKANNRKELKKAIKEAFHYDNKVIIEQFIIAQELECAILKGKNKIYSHIGEIKTDSAFYDYHAKYHSNEVETSIQPTIPKNIEEKIQEYSQKIFTFLEGKNLCRADFFYDSKENQIYFNEINTLPGFTATSMFPKLMEAENIPADQLIDILLTYASDCNDK